MAKLAKSKYKFTWTDEANEQFIHMRKKYDFMFTGARNTTQHGWSEIINKLELSEHVTPQQAKKRWENFVQRYRELSRSKPAGTITWKYYNLMDWACGNKETCDDDDSDEDEEQEQFIATETDSSQDNKFSVVRLAEDGQMEEVITTSMAECEETSPERTLLLAKKPSQPSQQSDPLLCRNSRQLSRPPAFATKQTSQAGEKHSNSGVRNVSMSVQSAAATLLDLAEQRQVDAITSVKTTLEELVALQRQTLESQCAQQQAMERLAEASERQAAALERLADLASQRHVMQENGTFL